MCAERVPDDSAEKQSCSATVLAGWLAGWLAGMLMNDQISGGGAPTNETVLEKTTFQISMGGATPPKILSVIKKSGGAPYR